MVDLSPEPLRSYMKELIEMRIEDPILPMEEGFGQLLKTHGEDLPDDKFSLFMNAMSISEIISGKRRWMNW